ncbi:MAG: formylglycine-generating enzyme family protein [Merismopedia sp. SIO2A8]|nr:formylglycine-generating enzyme family protein [Merismopedia sp. SIO2A8]
MVEKASGEGSEAQLQEGIISVARYVEPLSLSARDAPLEMVWVSTGTFEMGEERGAPSERPQHTVTVPACFMGRYPVTQAQWQAVASLPSIDRTLDPSPATTGGSNHPVENIEWVDMEEFCQRLSHHSGRLYRLPSEAEWEYACRAGTTTPFYFGATISEDVVHCSETARYNSQTNTMLIRFNGGGLAEVGSTGYVNAFGLCDMHGNIWELCTDYWHHNYNGAPTDGSAWLSNAPYPALDRVRRGGIWKQDPSDCRSARRVQDSPASRLYRGVPDVMLHIGFRIVCEVG